MGTRRESKCREAPRPRKEPLAGAASAEIFRVRPLRLQDRGRLPVADRFLGFQLSELPFAPGRADLLLLDPAARDLEEFADELVAWQRSHCNRRLFRRWAITG